LIPSFTVKIYTDNHIELSQKKEEKKKKDDHIEKSYNKITTN